VGGLLNPSTPNTLRARYCLINFTLWDHQKEAVFRAGPRDNFGLFFEVGTGKTLAAISILRAKFMEHDRILRTLILCPPIVVRNWKQEWKNFSNINYSNITCLTDSGKKRERMLLSRGFDPTGQPRGHIFITNYESLYMEGVLKALIRWCPDAIVFDESHKCKSIQTKRTKRCTTLADQAKYKYLLTGTPILNTPMDLYAQYRIMDGGETFGKNFYAFRANYFYDKNSGMPCHIHFPNWVPVPSKMDELHEKIKTSSMTVKKSECLSLPPLIRQEIRVELGKEQSTAYRQMEKSFIAFVGGGTCKADLALTKGIRLQQIASGFVPVSIEAEGTQENKIIRLADNPRALALKELLETITVYSKVVVWAVFKDNYDTIAKVCDDLKTKYVMVTGQQTPKQKDQAVEDFYNDKDVRVLIGHPGAGGIGINLIPASYSIFYSRNFSLEYDLQAEARNYRGGSEIHEKITRIDLVAEGTIDEKITEALSKKIQISNRVLQSIARELDNAGSTRQRADDT